MSRIFRTVAIATLSVIAFSMAANPASALNFSSRSLFGTAGFTTLTISTRAGGTVRAVCGSSFLTANLTNTGTGVTTAPASISVFTMSIGCTLAGTTVTVTPMNLPWTGSVQTAFPSGYSLTIGNMLIGFTTAAGCRFNVGGSETSDPATNPMSSISFMPLALPLSVSAITGGAVACAAAGIAAGNTASFSTTVSGYALTPPVTVTP